MDSIGALYVLLIVVLLSGVLLKGLSSIITLDVITILIGYSIVLSAFYLQRRDVDFLKSTDMNLFHVYLIDALLIGVVVCTIMVFGARFTTALGVLGLSVILPFVWSKFTGSFEISQTLNLKNIDFPFLSVIDFELKHLWRRYNILFSIVYMLDLVLIVLPASGFILAFVWLALLQSVSEYYEPKELILEKLDPSNFLIKKSLRILYITHIMFLPFYIFEFFYNQDLWYLPILLFFLLSVMIPFIIFNKYVFYRPGFQRVPTSALSSAMLIFAIIPGFQLIVLIMTLVQFKKANRNLSLYKSML